MTECRIILLYFAFSSSFSYFWHLSLTLSLSLSLSLYPSLALLSTSLIWLTFYYIKMTKYNGGRILYVTDIHNVTVTSKICFSTQFLFKFSFDSSSLNMFSYIGFLSFCLFLFLFFFFFFVFLCVCVYWFNFRIPFHHPCALYIRRYLWTFYITIRQLARCMRNIPYVVPFNMFN